MQLGLVAAGSWQSAAEVRAVVKAHHEAKGGGWVHTERGAGRPCVAWHVHECMHGVALPISDVLM